MIFLALNEDSFSLRRESGAQFRAKDARLPFSIAMLERSFAISLVRITLLHPDKQILTGEGVLSNQTIFPGMVCKRRAQ